MSFFPTAVKPVAITSLVCLLTLMAGCTREDSFVDYVATDITKSKVDDLSRSINFVKSEVRFEQAEFIDGVTNGLNRWVSYSKDNLVDSSWNADATFAPLVEQYSELAVSERLGELNFLNTDSYYLQQSYWVSLVSNRMAATQRYQPFELYRLAADDMNVSELDKPVDEIFKKLNGLDDNQAQRFANSMKIFDWICRNVNLESDAPLDESEIEDVTFDPDKEGAAAGVPGLGYQRYPWQTMLFGRGDYVERAKLMMLMLNQLGIDSVMLATGESTKPWAVAVQIDDEYYLFDTKLGLPIPGQKTGSVATLTMLQKNPELLTELDLSTDESLAENTKYWVRPDDLKSLTALMYASPDSVSKRMKALQGDLDIEIRKLNSKASKQSDDDQTASSQTAPASNRMLVSYSLDQAKSRLQEIDGVSFVPWDIAFKTHQYRSVIRTAVKRDSSEDQARLGWYYRTEAYVNGFRPYRTARGRFFKGKFKVVEDERSLNALQGWKRQMFSDDDIGNLSSDADMQRLHGIRQENQNSQAFANMLASVQSQMRLIRIDAKLFMAQSLFDNSNEGGIRGWLEDLKANSSDDPVDDNGRWNDAVTYLLARSFESQKLYDEAIENYELENLNQSHGNILRSRMLKQLIKKYYDAE